MTDWKSLVIRESGQSGMRDWKKGFWTDKKWTGQKPSRLGIFIPVGADACQWRRCKRCKFLGQEDPLEEEMATHSGILA